MSLNKIIKIFLRKSRALHAIGGLHVPFSILNITDIIVYILHILPGALVIILGHLTAPYKLSDYHRYY